jgi:hypothetical protein
MIEFSIYLNIEVERLFLPQPPPLTCTIGPGTRPGLTSMSQACETFLSARRESPGRVQVSSRLAPNTSDGLCKLLQLGT